MRMLKVLALLVFTNTAVSAQQLNIPKKHRCRNATGCQCVWVSLQTLALYHGIPEVNDLGEHYKTPSNPGFTRQVLRGRGARFLMHMPGVRNLAKLKEYCDNGWGAAVSVNNGSHMVTCVGYQDGKVYIIDNSDPQLSVRMLTEQQFLNTWDGWMVTLIPTLGAAHAGNSETPSER